MLHPNDWPFWLSFLIGLVLYIIGLIIVSITIWAIYHAVMAA